MADQKHLTRDSRHTIERGLNDGFSFKEIGRQLGKDCTTISKEVRNHRVFEKTGCFGRHFNNCENRKTCSVSGCCNSCARPKLRLCRSCPHCILVCPMYSPQPCPKLAKAPYTEYYTTREKNPLKKMQSLIAAACKLIRVFYVILKTGAKYDPAKMIKDIRRPEAA